MDKLRKSYLLIIALLLVPATAFADFSFNPITGKLDKVGSTTSDYDKILTTEVVYTSFYDTSDSEIVTFNGNVLTVG